MKEYIVLSRANNTARTGAPYIILTVADKEETLHVAVWDVPPTQGPEIGQLVSFFNLKENQGNKSCNASELKVGPMADAAHPLYNLVPHPIEQTVWDATIAHLCTYCSDKTLISLIQEFADKLYVPYSKYPAATSMHHAFPGGLINHTHQLLAMLDGIYPTLPYPVKIERCILAILFHDYGKLYEYKVQGETTEDMFLLGHIYIGAHKLHTELEKQGIDAEETKRIIHCILAHHGKFEFGSPVLPCTPEAMLVNHLDEISAKADNMEHTGHLEKSYALSTTVVKDPN